MSIVDYSSEIYNFVALDDLDLAMTLPEACRMKVSLSNGSGSVVFEGSLNGAAYSEAVTMSGNSWKLSRGSFDVLTRVWTSHLTNESTRPTIKIYLVDESGQDVMIASRSPEYQCVFGELGGLSNRARLKELGIDTDSVHYCRVSNKCPVEADDELEIRPNYDDMSFVPVTDIWSVRAPGSSVITDYEFYVGAKER